MYFLNLTQYISLYKKKMLSYAFICGIRYLRIYQMENLDE